MLYSLVEHSFHPMLITLSGHAHLSCRGAAQARIGECLRRNNRNYIRHPSELPLTFRTVNTPIAQKFYSSPPFVGLYFECTNAFPLGSFLALTVKICSEECSFQGQIEWIDEEEKHYALGISFSNESDAFCARMVEQIGYIEIYRRRLCEEEGYYIDTEQATREWIEKYSAHFPGLIEEEPGQDNRESLCHP